MNLKITQSSFLLNNRKFQYVYAHDCDCNDYFIRSGGAGTVVVWATKCLGDGEHRGHHCPKEIQFRSVERNIKVNLPMPQTKEGIDKLLKEWLVIPETASIEELW